jgi:hypothetical protein
VRLYIQKTEGVASQAKIANKMRDMQAMLEPFVAHQQF